MARYKDYKYDQVKMLSVSYEKQILPGCFEYSPSCQIDNELDLSALDQRYQNDNTGRSADDPKLLLKIIILAYSKCISAVDKLSAYALKMYCSCRYRQNCNRTIVP